MTTTRRSFLARGAACVATAAAGASFAAPALALSHPRIGLRCTHTDRSCLIDFDGTISSRDADAFRSVTRDWRRNKIFGMDLNLLPILSAISAAAGAEGTFGLISGYRSPETNGMLASRSGGVAKNSWHMQGRALDIRRGDLTTWELREIARKARLGGVGYYPKSAFVHVDTARVRYW